MQCDDPGIQSTIDRLEIALETFYLRDELVEHLATYSDDEIAVLSCRHNNQLSRIPREEQIDSLVLIYIRRQNSGRIQASEYLNRIQRTYPDEPLSMALNMHFKTKIDRWINYENRDETFVYLAINMNCQMLHDKIAEEYTDDIVDAWEFARAYAESQFSRRNANRPQWSILSRLVPINDADSDNHDITIEPIICPICLEESDKSADIVTTNCSHDFCADCLEMYLDNISKNAEDPTCPMCRTTITHTNLYMMDHLSRYQEKYGPPMNIPVPDAR
jgi:hypothetical protein